MKQSNNKYWALVVFAGLFEVFWVSGLKHSSTPLHWIGTVLAIIISFYLLILTSSKLPTSTAYAVFVGLGSAGTVVAEMVVFHEPFHWGKIILLTTLVLGVVGLKLVSHDAPSEENPNDSIAQGGN